jgi:hypothetical protein
VSQTSTTITIASNSMRIVFGRIFFFTIDEYKVNILD